MKDEKSAFVDAIVAASPCSERQISSRLRWYKQKWSYWRINEQNLRVKDLKRLQRSAKISPEEMRALCIKHLGLEL
jgi:hypothetical protein